MSNKTIMDKLKDAVIPSGLAGVAAVGIYYAVFDKNLSMTLPFAMFQVPVWAAVGGSAALGTLGGEILTEFVLPMIPKNENFQKIEELVIPPAVAGLTTYAVMRLLVSDDTELLSAVFIGAGAAVAGKYGATYVL